ncbi:MAG TPA: hypothetical protein PKL83_00010 [bacterium]|nr:hypothetical protein [bacterium]
MSLSIQQARGVLGKRFQHLSDAEIERVLVESRRWAQVILSVFTEERALHDDTREPYNATADK